MNTIMRRASLGGAVAAAILGFGVAAAPIAHAGGPGTIYVFGSTKASCEQNLSESYHSQYAHGKEIYGVQHCRKAGDGKRWFGYYTAD